MKRIFNSGLSLRMAFAILLSVSFFTCRIGVDEPVNNGGGNNNPPVFQQPRDTVINEGQTLRITLSASDPNGDVLTYSMRNGPSGASISGSVFTWTPDTSQAATYLIDFIVTEQTAALLRDTASVRITVQDTASIAGLVAYWDFNEGSGTTLTDRSGNGNHGAINGGATWVNGIEYGALNFNGANRYVVVPSDSSYQLNGTLTISVWVNLLSLNGGGIVSKYHDHGEYNYSMWYANDSLYFQVGSDGVFETTVATDAIRITNTWYHIVGRYDKMTLSLYINDSLIQNVPETRDLGSGSYPLCIGSAKYDCVTTHQWNNTENIFSGIIDGVMLYNRALSRSEISAEWSKYKDKIPATNGLVAYWPFNGNANDASGNGNNGTVNGATLTADRFGNASNTYNFDGNDWIEIPHAPQLDFSISSSYSISVWFRTSSDFQGSILEKWYATPNLAYPYAIRMMPSSSVLQAVRSNGPDASMASDSNAYNDGVWHQLTAVFQPATISIYIDGVLTESAANSLLSGNTSNTSNLFFGRRGNEAIRFYNGFLDDIRIYNRALTATEILVLYNEGN